MTRRQKKKRFKRKWLSGHHAVFLRTVPNKWKVSWADKINELYEEESNKRLDEMVLYGTQKRPPIGITIPMKLMQAFYRDSQ